VRCDDRREVGQVGDGGAEVEVPIRAVADEEVDIEVAGAGFVREAGASLGGGVSMGCPGK